MAMNYIETDIDPFFMDWFTCEKINLPGMIYTIVNDGVNEPYIMYRYDMTTEYPEFNNMVVIDTTNNAIVKNADKITEDEQKILHQFVLDNQKILLKYWDEYNSFELYDTITI